MSRPISPLARRAGLATAVVAALAAGAIVRPLAAQSRTTPAAGLKSPRVARVLGVVYPGLGHAYAGEWGRAFGFYELTVGGIGGAALLVAIAPDSREPSVFYALGGAEFALGVGSWVFSAIDAPRAARRANARHVAWLERRHSSIAPAVGVTRAGSLYAGLSAPF